MIKAVLFDLDGTLLDSVPNIMVSFEHTLKEMQIPFDEHQLRCLIGVPTEGQGRILAGDKKEDFAQIYRDFYRSLPHAPLFEGTKDMLEELGKQKLSKALVTSKIAGSAKKNLITLEIEEYFDFLIGADDVTNPKPHPEPLLKALEKLEISNDEAIYVGDSSFDVEAAQAAGVRVVAVSWGARIKEDLWKMNPTVVIDNWSELMSWLEKNGEVCI